MAYAQTDSTPLTASQDKVVAYMQVGLADRIAGAIFADQACTIYIEQSGDGQLGAGAHWDISTSYAVSASDGSGFSEELVLPFARIRVVNGATPMTAFRVFARTTSAGSN